MRWIVGCIVLCVSCCLVGCGGQQMPTTLPELRTEARSLAAAHDRQAARYYRRLEHDAARDHVDDATLEAAIYRSGGDPSWVDALSPEALATGYTEMRAVDAGSDLVAGLYVGGGATFALGAIMALGAGVWALAAEGPGANRDTPVILLGVAIGLGALGLGTFIAAIVLDFDSGAQRQRWLDSLHPSALTWSITPEGLQLGGHF